MYQTGEHLPHQICSYDEDDGPTLQGSLSEVHCPLITGVRDISLVDYQRMVGVYEGKLHIARTYLGLGEPPTLDDELSKLFRRGPSRPGSGEAARRDTGTVVIAGSHGEEDTQRTERRSNYSGNDDAK